MRIGFFILVVYSDLRNSFSGENAGKTSWFRENVGNGGGLGEVGLNQSKIRVSGDNPWQGKPKTVATRYIKNGRSNSERELEELRLDEDFLQDDLNKDLLMDYCDKFQSKAFFRCSLRHISFSTKGGLFCL